MDRTQAFAEYGRILQDSMDWLDGGYRRIRPEMEIHLPPGTPPQAEPMRSESVGEVSVPAETTHPSRTSVPTDPPNAVIGTSPVNREPMNTAPEHPADGSGAAPSIQPLPVAGVPSSPPVPVDPAAQVELSAVAGEVAECRACNLYLLRTNTVPGIGVPGATLMVVTPPPNDSATETSNPLPTYENEYLGKWLSALGLNLQSDVFITPAVKCHTPGGRPPQQEEAASCAGYLRRQYKTVAPRAVLALGGAACGALTGDPADFPSLVGRDWTWGAVPALVLWTPAEVLANPGRLRKPVWDSLQRLKAAWNAVPGTQL